MSRSLHRGTTEIGHPSDEGLRGILRRHQDQVREVACDSVCLLDLNTPGEYAEARQAFGLAV